MSAALKDLPDPLDASPTMATSNPDDLLAKMADEAIDRLMAEADKGAAPSAPPVPMTDVADVPAPPASLEAAADALPETSPPASSIVANPEAPVAAPTTNARLNAAFDKKLADADAATHGVIEPTADVAASHVETAASGVVKPDATPLVASEPLAAADPRPADPHPPSPPADLRALLHEDAPPPSGRPSPLLWPLWLLNLPFAGMSDDARRIFGLLGVVTLVPAATAIAFAVWLKRH